MHSTLRIRGIGGTLVAFALLATACTSAATPSASTPAPAATSSAQPSDAPSTDPGAALAGTTVTVWTMEDATKFETLIQPFVDATGIKVDVEAVPWDNVNEKLTTAVASGEGPDVTQVGLSLLPTTTEPSALAPRATLLVPPGRKPRPLIMPPDQMKAWPPPKPPRLPTTTEPSALAATALLLV